MALTTPQTLASAADYQAAFNNINRPAWAGCYNIVPCQLSDGRRVFFTGLSWAGGLTSTGTRSTSAPTMANSALIQQGSQFVPFSPVQIDGTGMGYLLDSRALPGVSTLQRLEPIAAVSWGQSVYMTVRLVTGTGQFPGGDVYLIEIPVASLGNGRATIRQAVQLDNQTVSQNPGYGLNIWGDYLYLTSRAGTGPYSYYLSRVSLQYLRTLPALRYNLRYLGIVSGAFGWQEDARATPFITNAGNNLEIWYSANRLYNYLYRDSTNQVGADTVSLRTMYRSGTITGSTVYTGTVDSGSTGFFYARVKLIPWAQLSSGNQLGVASISHTTGNAFDVANPLTARPRFFEFPNPSLASL